MGCGGRLPAGWSDIDVAERWCRLFPREDEDAGRRVALLTAQPERIAVLRARLAELSWFMRCLSEPIARRANREDGCKGRFWEGRFKCQALLDDRAVLAAMAYVDLNPVRAKLCDTLAESSHTSARQRLTLIEQVSTTADNPLTPTASVPIGAALALSQADYLHLLDWTGRQIRPDKRGAIAGPPPQVLRRFGPNNDRWAREVLALGSDFHRAIGSVEALIDKARALGQNWLQGLNAARGLAAPVA